MFHRIRISVAWLPLLIVLALVLAGCGNGNY